MACFPHWLRALVGCDLTLNDVITSSDVTWKRHLQSIKGTLKILLVCVILIFLMVEWLEYALLPMVWPKFPSGLKDSIRILIVSDPQLLGNDLSPPGILGYIYQWDADRYVSKTFSYAHHYVVPDIVIFLGDNFDEGEIANDVDFFDYIKRFRHIFKEVDFHKSIIIPGDNDIGGEDEPPSQELEIRFNKYFREDVFIPYRFLEFVKVNYITHSNDYLNAPNFTDSAFRIALSHIPLTSMYSTFISRVIPYLKPHIILSAHDHKSGHWMAHRQSGFATNTTPDFDFNVLRFNISQTYIHEIMVPTCSYRMGTNKMGYGAMELSIKGEVFYVVLWLPSRFRQIYVYLFCMICFGLYLCLLISRICCKFISRQNVSCKYSYNKLYFT